MQAGCALICIIPVTCAAIRRHHPQFALKSHYLLTVIAISGVVYHLIQRQSLYRWFLLGAISLWLACSFGVWAATIIAQKPWRNTHCEMITSTAGGVLWFEVMLPIDRTVTPGQYVQLWMPRAGVRASLQLALFYVTVCDCNGSKSRRTVRMMARPRPGLTDNLYRAVSNSRTSQSVTVLGPYGRAHDFSRFGTVIFVVEDIGLFRALPYIEMLVEASRRREVMIRKVEILWQRAEAYGQSIPN